jgi:ATP-dependent protease ClpP protease subunit
VLIEGAPADSLTTVVTEAGVRYGIDFAAGYSVGFFMDQRANRALLRRIAPRILTGDKGIPPYQITVDKTGKIILFHGGIRAGSAEAFAQFLIHNPDSRAVDIESVGGRIEEAIKIMDLIRTRKLSTFTSGQCASAATLVLLSGTDRAIESGATVGFHAGRLPGATTAQQRSMDDTVRTAMESAGVRESFIQKVLDTPPPQLWFPSARQMIDEGVITRVSYDTWKDVTVAGLKFSSPCTFNLTRHKNSNPEDSAVLTFDSFRGQIPAGLIIITHAIYSSDRVLPSDQTFASNLTRSYRHAVVSNIRNIVLCGHFAKEADLSMTNAGVENRFHIATLSRGVEIWSVTVGYPFRSQFGDDISSHIISTLAMVGPPAPSSTLSTWGLNSRLSP